jgi:predicted PurR-regulated permease PerM
LLAGLLVTTAVVLLVVGPTSLLVVGTFQQASAVLAALARQDAPTIESLATQLRTWLPLMDALGSPAEVRAMVQAALTSASNTVSGAVLTQLALLPDLALQLVVVVLATYFFLVDGRRAFHWVAGKIPLSRQIRDTLALSFQSASNAVVLASVAAAGAQSFCLFLGFVLLRVPAAFLAAGAAVVLAWIPTVGVVPIWGLATAWLYSEGDMPRAATMLVIGGFVSIVDNVVRPLVLRGREEMHPLLSLLAILGGIVLLGVPGVFLGPLVVSLALAVFEIWPAVASSCGIPVSASGDTVPQIPLDGPSH